MRKVKLSMNEDKKYATIKKLAETNGNKNRAAIELGCSRRTIDRMLVGYKTFGKGFFLHGNRNRKPVLAFSNDKKSLISGLYLNKYYDASFTHFAELLKEFENIDVSVSSIHNILEEQNIVSVKATRAKKKKMRKRLLSIQSKSKSKVAKAALQASIIALEDAHPRRPRKAYFGEQIQMDASLHLWFGSEKSQLHIAIDDASGTIVGAYFDRQETLAGYYNVFYQILVNYGIPYEFLTDNRTIFEYKQKRSPSLEEDTYTQFAYACKQLGTNLKTSSVAQAKGRVERVFETLQLRLPVLLRLAGVTELSEANEFLNSYIKKFNAKFARQLHSTKSVFVKQPSREKINLTLAILTGRKIDNGHCIKFKNIFYKTLNEYGQQVCYRKGTESIVVKAFDGKMFCCVGEKVHALQIVPDRNSLSPNFDFLQPKQSAKKQYIPDMAHPWRKMAFWNFVNLQKHSFLEEFYV